MLDYHEKPAGYYTYVRREIVNKVPVGQHDVLEIGCGEGGTGAALKKEGRARSVAGIELMEKSAEKAKEVLDQVLVGNIEQMSLPFVDGQFDVIILADVLEHLVDPWSTLRRLRSYLKRGGLVVISLPNVRNWRVLMPLVFLGRWKYQDEGIMDRTHLRFFSRKAMMDLLNECDFEIKVIEPTGKKSEKLSNLGIGFLSELLAVQYVLVGRAGATTQ
jgi:2-polyprenyl-3-methyl-5-hydroxy-6-metoxy-1,4-benzoquinol methylase